MEWNSIIEDLGPKLFRYFRARFSEEVSSDLTQETLIRLVQKARDGHYDSARGNLRMYAYGIAHFVALEAHKEKPPLPPASETTAESFEEALSDRQRSETLRRALLKLDPIQVQIISLMIDEELTVSDIGTLLDMPVGTVKSHIFRAKERLREIIATKESV